MHVASCSTSCAVYKVLGAPGRARALLPRPPRPAGRDRLRCSATTATPPTRGPASSASSRSACSATTVRSTRSPACARRRGCSGVPLQPDCSDSQDLSRTIESLIYRQGLTLVEALELTLPPIVDEVKGLPAEPARLLHVPAPGVRPLRAGPGGADLALRRRARVLRRRPRPAPAVAGRDGRRVRVLLRARRGRREPTPWPSPSRSRPARRCAWRSTAPAGETTLHDHGEMQASVRARWRERTGSDEGDAGYAGAILTGGPLEGAEIPGYTSAGPSEPVKVEDRVLGGFGWQREDMKLVQQMAATGQEPIGSLGYDGPLACALARAPEPGRLLQGVGGGGDQPGDRPRARGGALLLPRGDRRAAVAARGRARAARRSRSRSRSCSAATTAWPRSRTRPTARSPTSTRPTCSRTSGRRSAGAAPCSTSPAWSPRTPRARSSASSRRPPPRSATAPSWWCSPTAPPTRATAATSIPTSRWPPWTWRCAST